MDNTSDWSGLLSDLLVGIALHLQLMEDFMAFKGVCTNWRAAGAIKTELFKAVSKVPLLMLSEKDDSDEREFYSFFKKKILFKMPVPEARGKRCIYVGFGWILAVSSSTFEMSLFNPFSSSPTIELPNLDTLPGYGRQEFDPEFLFLHRGMLSANPSVTSDFTVFVVGIFVLGLWRNEDKSWTRMEVDFGEYGSLLYCQRKLYAVNVHGEIFAGDTYGIDRTKARIIHWKDPLVRSRNDWMPYLVESSTGELLIILRSNYQWDETLRPSRFRFMAVDFVKMECKEINDIGKEAIFLGDNTTISVAADGFPGVKPNCIYFTDDCLRRYYFVWEDNPDEKYWGKEMGIYNVKDRSRERFNIEFFSNKCPPLWIFPSF